MSRLSIRENFRFNRYQINFFSYLVLQLTTPLSWSILHYQITDISIEMCLFDMCLSTWQRKEPSLFASPMAYALFIFVLMVFLSFILVLITLASPQELLHQASPFCTCCNYSSDPTKLSSFSSWERHFLKAQDVLLRYPNLVCLYYSDTPKNAPKAQSHRETLLFVLHVN